MIFLKKYYAIQKGRKPGVYQSWPEAQKQVAGFKGAVFKGFTDLKSAQAFINRKEQLADKVDVNQFDVLLYTDGGTRNTGNVRGGHVKQTDKAAWAYLIKQNGKSIPDSKGHLGATNNQMEITALVKGLSKLVDLKLNNEKVLLIADSKYVLDSISKGWLQSWKAHDWHKSNGGPVANVDLWKKVDELLPQFTQLTYSWTKGHNDNQGNIFVDHLLNKTMDEM